MDINDITITYGLLLSLQSYNVLGSLDSNSDAISEWLIVHKEKPFLRYFMDVL